MITIDKNTTLEFDKILEDKINIVNNSDLILNVTKYLNLNINIDINKEIKANIYLITKYNTKLNITINLNDNSSIKLYTAFFGKKNNNEFRINLNGINSNCNVQTISLSNNGSSTYYTYINHINNNTNSIVNNRLLLNNKSEVLADIKSNIKNKSINSTSKQSIEGILLDNTSKLEMIPTLYIDDNNVFANHSSKIYKINDNDLYYLMSKGLTKEDANKLYANSFLIKNSPEEFKDEIIKLIERSI